MDDQGVLRVRDSDRTPSRAGVTLICSSAQFGKEWNHEPTVSMSSSKKKVVKKDGGQHGAGAGAGHCDGPAGAVEGQEGQEEAEEGEGRRRQRGR